MKILFVEEAETEFLEGISYYEDVRPGFGRRFKDEVESAVRLIARSPEIFRERNGGYRRVNLRVFPYFIPFIVRGDTLWVLSVAHGSRQPLYWIARRVSIG